MPEKSDLEIWYQAYFHIPSNSISRMLLVDDGSRPIRTQVMKQILATHRFTRRRIGSKRLPDHRRYVEFLL